jgi:uridine phosphorylase
MVERFITPAVLFPSRFPELAHRPKWDAAVICFRDPGGSRLLVEALGGVPWGRKVFWGIEETPDHPRVFVAQVAGRTVGIVTHCIWGTAQASILVEELAELGVPIVIGYGAAGSFDSALPQGTQLVACSAPATDGASKQYGNGPFSPDPELLALVRNAEPAVVATVDAVYRETPELVAEWRAIGAQVVNMESAPFYAAAQACGVRALWLGHVSDMLLDEWHGWHVVSRDEMTHAAIANCRHVLEHLPPRT